MAKRRSGRSGRGLATRVKTAKGRKSASTRWLRRQLNDPYVAAAQADGLRSRAAYKLAELDDRFHFIKMGARIVELGAAPGGWTQIAVRRSGADGDPPRGRVVALDLAQMDPIRGAHRIELDFFAEDAPARIMDALEGPADLVLSDMAPALTGHAKTDHLRIMEFLEAAFQFACETLAPGGHFVAKVFQGGTESQLLALMKRRFASVRHAKPPASRAESSEFFVVAMGFRGTPD